MVLSTGVVVAGGVEGGEGVGVGGKDGGGGLSMSMWGDCKALVVVLSLAGSWDLVSLLGLLLSDLLVL